MKARERGSDAPAVGGRAGQGGPAGLRLSEVRLAEIVTAGTGRAPDAALRESMARYGLLEPIDLRARTDGGYELIGGSRRRLAAFGLGWATISAIVEPASADALPAALKALLLNLHRESLQQIHLALQAQRVQAEFDGTQAELARRLKIGRSTLSQMLSVARCAELVAAVQDDGLPFAGAKRLLALPKGDREALLAELRSEAAAAGRYPLVREIEARVRERLGQAPLPAFSPGDLPDLLLALEARAIPVRVHAIPGKQSRMEVALWLDEAHQAELAAVRAQLAPRSPGGTR